MNCTDCIAILDQYLDRELARAEADEVRVHSDSCRDCAAQLQRKNALRKTLREMPYEDPEHGFYDRVLENTVVATQRSETKFWASAGLGTAIAASIVGWMVLVLPVEYGQDLDVAQLDEVTISLNVEKTVKISFESVSDLEGATLTVQLPPGVEVAGYGGRSEISWSTDVTQGVNILALPIVIRSGSGGTVVAQVEHTGKSKSFKFEVSAS